MTLIDKIKFWWAHTSVKAAFYWAAVQAAWPLLAPAYQETLLGAIVGPERVQQLMAVIAFAHIVRNRTQAQPELAQMKAQFELAAAVRDDA